MASRNADHQRLSARGLVHVQGWATPTQAETIRRILAEQGGAAPHEPLDPQRTPETGFSQKPA